MLSADATPDTANAVDPRTRTLVLVTSRFDDNPRRTSRRPWPEANSSGWTSTCTTPGPDDDVDGLLTGTFHFHPLAVTSAVRFGQRPRIDNFDDFTQVITIGMAGDGKEVAGIHCFINEKFVVTLREGKCPALLAVVLQRVRDHRDTQIPPQVGLLYLILDSLIDSFFPVLSDMDDDIDNLESAILKNPTEEQLGTLFDMKKRVMTIRRVVAPQRDMIESLNGGVVSIPGMTDTDSVYFRSVYDHTIRITDMVDSYRDLISGAMDTHLPMVSNRLNVIMKQLAIVATFFLPLGFRTGFFGQNFAWLTNHAQASAAGWAAAPPPERDRRRGIRVQVPPSDTDSLRMLRCC